jgi:hypothetical protein
MSLVSIGNQWHWSKFMKKSNTPKYPKVIPLRDPQAIALIEKQADREHRSESNALAATVIEAFRIDAKLSEITAEAKKRVAGINAITEDLCFQDKIAAAWLGGVAKFYGAKVG